MSNVRIVTDVTAYLDAEFIQKHQITVLPMQIRFGEETFVIHPNEDVTRLFEQMAAGPARISRATTSTRALELAYNQLSRETEEILVILASSKLSDTFDKAQAAAPAFLGRCRITVLDSMSTDWGLGLIVKEAARAATDGQPLDEIVRLVRGMLPHIYIVFLIERLDYLERGGRLGVAQALLGTTLRIKPLLLVEGGDIVSLEKMRTRNMALDKLVDFVAEFATIREVVILHSPLDDEMTEMIADLQDMLSEVLPGREFPVVEYGPLLACHIGPEALGVVVYEGD